MSIWLGVIGFLIIAGAFLGSYYWGWAVFGLFLLYTSVSRFWSKYKAASNAIIAKYTYTQLSKLEQNEVLASVKKIMTNADYPIADPEEMLKDMNQAQRYGFFALGMLDIGIPPKLGGGWYDVSNPYTQILRANRELAWVQHQLKMKHGVIIEFQDA